MSLFSKDIVKQVLAKLDARTILKIINYRHDTIQEAGGFVRCFCPIHKETVFRTLSIDSQTSLFKCSYNLCPGAKGGDLIALFARSKGADYDDALRALVTGLKLDIDLPETAVSFDQLLEAAKRDLAAGSLDNAAKGFQKIIKGRPDQMEAWEGLLRVHEKSKNQDAWLQTARDLAAQYIKARQHRDALVLCGRILEITPEDPEALEQSARCYEELNNRGKALETYMTLAGVFEAQGVFERAVEVYRAVERMDLDVLDVYPYIINALVAGERSGDALSETQEKLDAYLKAKDWDHALDCIRYIYNLDERRDDMRRRYIELTVEAGMTDARFDKAMDALEELIEHRALDDAAAARELMARACPDHPRLMRLATLIHKARGEDAAAMETQIAMADQLSKGGAEVQARSVLEELQNEYPDSLPVVSRLARIYQNAGEEENALAAFRSLVAALDRLPPSGQGAGLYDEMLSILQAICEMSGADLEAQFDYIRLALVAGRDAKAVDHIDRLLRRYEDERHYEQALKLIERHGMLLPNQGAMLALKSRCLEGLGQTEQAYACLLEACEAYLQTDHGSVAMELLLKHIQRHPDDKAARQELKEIKKKMSAASSASNASLLKAFKKSLAKDDPEAVAQAVERLIESAPRNTDLLEETLAELRSREMTHPAARICDHLKEAFTARGATNKALEYAAARLTLTPDQPEALEQALGMARAAQRFGPLAGALLVWAQVEEEHGRFPAALELFESLARDLPDDNDLRGAILTLLAETELSPEIERRALETVSEWARSRHAAQAEKFCRERLEADPDHALWNELMMALLREMGQEERLRQQELAYAQILARQHQWARAVEILNGLLLRDSQNMAARQQIIAALRALQRTEEAVTHSLSLARALAAGGKHKDAEAAVRRAAEIAPNDTSVHAELAEIFHAAGAAKEECQARWRLAELFEKESAFDQAIAQLRLILERDASQDKARQRLKALEGELRTVNKAVEKYTTDAQTHHEGGDLRSEIAALSEAVRLKPSDTQLRRRLAQACFDSGAPEEGLKQMDDVALRHFAGGAYREALATLDEILGIDGARLQARKLRAECLARLGDDRQALDEFLKISSVLKPERAEEGATEEDNLDGALELVAEYSFEQFVVGAPNDFAYATALAVARAPAQQYNPLFLHSDVGLGKTHLLNAIANHISVHHPEMKIVYISADDFASSLVEAISNNRMRAFRNRFRSAGALLIDDIQFLAGKERAQEEFFNIFNGLFQSRKQIVITSDRPPKDLAPLEKRLRSRFAAGIVVDILPPDQETREAILRRDRAALGQDDKVPDDVVHEIAVRMESNIRELKAAFRQVLATAEITSKPPTLEPAQRVLARLKG
ncbi:MAG: DnaA/Hda family protein [Candidatus Sumerlaeota bacterium]|nr:DnaA/Hda family protein [Candidatus Sumerlaeota bacterium]